MKRNEPRECAAHFFPLNGGSRGVRAGAAGFTLVELILVLFIMVLLVAVAAPTFSRLLKSSRVQIAANQTLAACYRARAEAQRFRMPVGVFFGDDLSKNPVKPQSGVLPPYGQIEVWSVKYKRIRPTTSIPFAYRANVWEQDEMGDGAMVPPGLQCYWMQDKPLTPEPITFPDGVRILAGNVLTTVNVLVPCTAQFYFSNLAYTSPTGTIKRHTMTYAKNGCAVSYADSVGYRNLLVFDTASGDHLIIEAAEFKSSTRPRILMGSFDRPLKLTKIGKRTSNATLFPSSGNLTDHREIMTYIDQ